MAMHKKSGFTLVELLVTLGVLAIIVMLAVPSFENLMVKRKLRGAIELFYSQVVFAKAQAVKESEEIFVTFTQGNDGAWDFGVTNTAGGCNPGADPADCLLAYTDDQGNAQSLTKDFDGAVFPDVSMTHDGAGGTETLSFEPVRGIATIVDISEITLTTSGPDYELRLNIDAIGRVDMCTPSDKEVTGYTICP